MPSCLVLFPISSRQSYNFYDIKVHPSARESHPALSEFIISADFDGNEDGERVADFSAAGLWVWNAGEMSIHAPTLSYPVETSQAVLLAQETDGHESDDDIHGPLGHDERRQAADVHVEEHRDRYAGDDHNEAPEDDAQAGTKRKKVVLEGARRERLLPS
jgi:hypothetical protein